MSIEEAIEIGRIQVQVEMLNKYVESHINKCRKIQFVKAAEAVGIDPGSLNKDLWFVVVALVEHFEPDKLK